MKFKSLVQGFGIASLILILRLWPHLSHFHPIVYHSFLPMQTVVWGVLIDLAVVSLLAACLLYFLQRNESGWRTVLWPFLAAELAATLVAALAAMHRAAIPLLSPGPVFDVVLIAGLVLRWLCPFTFQRLARGVGILLVLAGCSMVWMVPELLFQALRKQPSDASTSVRALAGVKPASALVVPGRIVWFIFDELSYDQTFDHRFPGLALPSFDKFKSESTSFSDVQPAGYYTDRVIPSFFLGQRIDSLRSNLDGIPSLQFAGSKQWRPFDPQATLFADARRLGWTTGIVGWYNPYCRILAGMVDWCYWRMGDGQSDGALSERSVWQNAAAPLSEQMREWEHKPGFPHERHAEDLKAVMPQAETLLRDESIRFVLIHLPVPHPPGIYDRRPGHPRAVGSYIDNTALADSTLGALMAVVDATAAAPETTVIVCSDHSWRIPMWRSTPVWTKEDEAASHGRFDPRPVLMVHLPRQKVEHDVNTPFDGLRLHDIIEGLLRGSQP